MFSDGVTILDAADPRRLKPAGFFGGRQHAHAPPAGGQRPDAAGQRRQHRGDAVMTTCAATSNALVDSISNKKKFRSGLSIHDISKPGEMREIAFLGSRASASTVCGGPVGATLIWPSTSTATPITSRRSSICRT
jgi:hypothetical protein